MGKTLNTLDYSTDGHQVFCSGSDEDEEKRARGKLSADWCRFRHQVSGHADKGQHLGIIKYKEALLKPIRKSAHLEREVRFYEHLKHLSDDCMCNHDALIKNLVPTYYGRYLMPIDNNYVTCVMLEDLTRGMREPCIMDVKIGKRTWDPEASLQKIQNEETKYKETKHAYGICITGFQVYDVVSGGLQKYDKAYGKQLKKETIVDAIRIFLNAANENVNRMLLVQLLVNLWRIQHWARKQYKHRLYGSSILLIYDARRLRQTMDLRGGHVVQKVAAQSPLKRTNSLYRPMSLARINDKCTRTGFSGQFGKDGLILPCLNRRKHICQVDEYPVRKSVPNLKRIHSFQNNYDEDLRNIRSDYANMLEDLVEEDHNELWATAKMIDFSHAFPTTDHANQIDHNYLHGIENLVSILEGFLVELDTNVI